jgi:uncharacterized protein (UPF0264 family)
VSVSAADEAHAAIEGGADIVDAKNPHDGALGPVSLDALAAIRRAIGPARLLTAALGDAREGNGRRATGDGSEADAEDSRLWTLDSGSATTDIESTARAYAQAGAALVKVGCAGRPDVVGPFLAAAVRGAGRGNAGVVAVAYADANGGAIATLHGVIELARAAGARGVLVDTADKSGPGLTSLVAPGALAEWVSRARAAGLLAAVAGSLSLGDLPVVAACGADVAGVRGAACDGGRLGRVTAQRVASLSEMLRVSAGTPTAFQGSP